MFVIVDYTLGAEYKKPGHFCAMQYTTLHGAKCAATRLNKSCDTTRFGAMSVEQYQYYYPTKIVERVNIMSGKTFSEAEDTPYFCSPSSETYWSS